MIGMSKEDFYTGIKSATFNYQAKIVPREQISDTIRTKVIAEAEEFLCLITPYWTIAGIRELGLIPLLQQKLKENVKIYLFSRYEALPRNDYNNSVEIFKNLHNAGIINCWHVRNLHGKLYYNEKNILLTSANFTTTSLGFARGRYENNFEEGVLLKLKPIKKSNTTRLYFSNINPFMIPPFYYMKIGKGLSELPKKRFLLGCGYHKTSDIEIPALFSFPEMMKDWLLSSETSQTYRRERILNNKLTHLGEREGFCPICRKSDCDFSRTYICHKYGIEYPDMKNHCKSFLDCNKGPIFRTHEFYKLRCPITVFYCPSRNMYYDPAKDKLRDSSDLFSVTNAREVFYEREFMHSSSIDNIFVYCPNCKSILQEQELYAHFTDEDLGRSSHYSHEIEIYKCPICNNYRLKECPECDDGFTLINIENEYYHCEKRNMDYPFHVQGNS